MEQHNHQRTMFGITKIKKTSVQLKLNVVVLKTVKLINSVREQVINVFQLVRA